MAIQKNFFFVGPAYVSPMPVVTCAKNIVWCVVYVDVKQMFIVYVDVEWMHGVHVNLIEHK